MSGDVSRDAKIRIQLDGLVDRHFVDVLRQLCEGLHGDCGLDLRLVGEKHARRHISRTSSPIVAEKQGKHRACWARCVDVALVFQLFREIQKTADVIHMKVRNENSSDIVNCH